MKLLVGRLVLVSILAVLVLADEPAVEVTVESEKSAPEVAATPEPPEAPALKIFSKPDNSHNGDIQHEIVVIPGNNGGHGGHHGGGGSHGGGSHGGGSHGGGSHGGGSHGGGSHGGGSHGGSHGDNHGGHGGSHGGHWDNDNDHHHHPLPHNNPQPNYPYNPYYPPYYPPPYGGHYGGHQVYSPVPGGYPYYPPQNYYPAPQLPIRPVTVIHTNQNSGSGSSYVKPTDLLHQSTGYLWNLIDQKNTELWNLIGNKHGGSSGDSSPVHEVVVINTKPGNYPGSTIVHGGGGSSSGGGSGWFNKGKSAGGDCNESE